MARHIRVVAFAALIAVVGCGNTTLQRSLSGAIVGGAAASLSGQDIGAGVALGATVGLLMD